MYTPPMNMSRIEVGSLGFDATHVYQYMDEHFSRINLRLDAIDGRQQQHAQDLHKLFHRQMESNHRQCNLEHHVYYIYEHQGYPYSPLNWRPSVALTLMLCEPPFLPFAPFIP